MELESLKIHHQLFAQFDNLVQEWFAQFDNSAGMVCEFDGIVQDWFSARAKSNPVENPSKVWS